MPFPATERWSSALSLLIEEHPSATLFEILLPQGGFIIVYQAYADASLTKADIPKDSRVLTVASFLFEKDKSKILNEEWAKILYPVLRNERRDKQYFHMHDFFTRKPPYHLLNEGERLVLQRELIDSAHRNMETGVVASVLLSEYREVVATQKHQELLGSPFAMLNLWCMDDLFSHLNVQKKEGDIAFFFEDGDSDKVDLEQRLSRIAASDYLKTRYRYGGRAFIMKHQHHALGAADMLAWEYRNAIEQHFSDPTKDKRVFVHVLFEEEVGARHFHPGGIRFRSMAQAIERANVWAEERRRAADATMKA